MVNCVAMMTHNDVTVPHALEVFEANKHTKAMYWGFKDDGVTLEEGEELIKAMQAAGKFVVLEPLTKDEEMANKWADLAIKYHVDGVLGYYFDSVCKKLKEAGVRYFPPFGRRTENNRLLGTIDELKDAALEIVNAGAGGVRMSAYRYIEGDPEQMAKEVGAAVRAAGGDFMMTGSVDDFGNLDFIKEMQPWGITVGGALFDEGKFGGGTVAERMDRIEDYVNGK